MAKTSTGIYDQFETGMAIRLIADMSNLHPVLVPGKEGKVARLIGGTYHIGDPDYYCCHFDWCGIWDVHHEDYEFVSMDWVHDIHGYPTHDEIDAIVNHVDWDSTNIEEVYIKRGSSGEITEVGFRLKDSPTTDRVWTGYTGAELDQLKLFADLFATNMVVEETA